MGFNKHISFGLLVGVMAITAGTASRFYVKKDELRSHPGEPVIDPLRAHLDVDPETDYQIVSVSANKCVQLAGDPPVDGAEAQIWTCGKSTSQRFRFEARSDGYYTIRLAGTKRCLDVEGLLKTDGTLVKGFGCHGGDNQQWLLADSGVGIVRLVARHSGRVMDVWAERTDDGAVLKQYFWKEGARNQLFRLQTADPIEPNAGAPPSRLTGR